MYRLKFGIPKRKCRYCGIEYTKSKKFSLSQWSNSKYCSSECAGKAKKINDGMNKNTRHRRKIGMYKQGTPEWLNRIKVTTKNAMYKPEINMKLRKKRSPLTLQRRIEISNSLVGKLPKNMISSGAYPNIQRGNYENSKGTMYFRSKWEANYALYLDFLVKQKQIKGWDFEKDTFIFESILFGTRSYLPDFKIYNNDGSFEYHEVKGYMDGRSKTKLRRMAKYYPEIKLILIDKEVYESIKKSVGKMCNFY